MMQITVTLSEAQEASLSVWIGRPRAQFDINEMVAAYEAGGTLKEIGQQYSVSSEAVRQRLLAAGVETRSISRAKEIKRAQRDAEIIQLYRSGETIPQIAERFGIGPGAIKQRLVNAGVTIRPKASKLDEQIVEMCRAYEGGASLHELADRYSSTTMTVRRRLIAAGVEMRRVGNKKVVSLPIAEITRLYNGGQSISRIAQQFGIASSTVRERLVEAGVKIRRGRRRGGGLDGRITEARQAYENGAALHELADRYSVGIKTLRQQLVAAGTEMRPRSMKLLPVEEMARLYEEGQSLAYIAEQCGTSPATVKQRLIQANVEVRSPAEQARNATRLPIPIEELILLYQEGYSMDQIAKRFGVSRATVRRRFVEANVERRPARGRPGHRGDL